MPRPHISGLVGALTGQNLTFPQRIFNPPTEDRGRDTNNNQRRAYSISAWASQNRSGMV
jgi:hypothetical protein